MIRKQNADGACSLMGRLLCCFDAFYTAFRQRGKLILGVMHISMLLLALRSLFIKAWPSDDPPWTTQQGDHAQTAEAV